MFLFFNVNVNKKDNNKKNEGNKKEINDMCFF